MGRIATALVVALGWVATSAGCYAGTGPGEGLHVAVIGFFFEDAPRITVPDTVTAGQSFTVTVDSYGNACVRLGPTEVDVIPGGAVVTPLDFVATGGICADILLTFEHEASLSLTDFGAHTVVVRGREMPNGPVVNFPHEVWVR